LRRAEDQFIGADAMAMTAESFSRFVSVGFS
jgi:hypothetical protein